MLRNFLAFLFSFIFLIFSIPFFLLYGLFGTFQNEEIYLGKGLDLAYEILVSKVPTMINIEEFASLEQKDVGKLIENVISKDDFRNFVDEAISSVTSAHVNEDYKLTITIPLDLLANERDDLAKGLTDLFYEKLPECADGGQPLQCIPPGFAKADFQFEVGKTLDQAVFADLPSEFELNLNVPYKFEGTVSDFFGKIEFFILLIFGVFALFAIFVMTLIVWSPLLRIIKWISLALFLSSFLVIFYCLLLLIAPQIFESKLANEFANAEIFSAYMAFYNFIVISFFKNVLIFALPVLILALGGFIFRFVISKRKIHDAS